MQIMIGAEAGVFVATISSIGAVEVAAGAEDVAGAEVDAGAGSPQPIKAAVETRTIARTNNNVFFILPSLFMTFTVCSGYFYTISSPEKEVPALKKQNYYYNAIVPKLA